MSRNLIGGINWLVAQGAETEGWRLSNETIFRVGGGFPLLLLFTGN